MIKLGKSLLRSWTDMVRKTGQSFLDLLRAEFDQLVRELGGSAKKLGIGIALLLAAAMVLFWWFAVLGIFLIEVLALWLPRWGAAGVVLLTLLLITAVIAFLGLRRLQSIDNPVDTVGRRWDDHLDWWENRLLPDDELRPDPVGAESRKELV